MKLEKKIVTMNGFRFTIDDESSQFNHSKCASVGLLDESGRCVLDFYNSTDARCSSVDVISHSTDKYLGQRIRIVRNCDQIEEDPIASFVDKFLKVKINDEIRYFPLEIIIDTLDFYWFVEIEAYFVKHNIPLTITLKDTTGAKYKKVIVKENENED